MSSFSFPFKSNNNNKTSPASMEEFFSALSMESDGFYPFGVNEFWHGGVHITNKSSGALKQGDGVRCIAEGEVVAYRINEKHIDTPAYEDPSKGTSINIPYSTSFTLVRHELVYPAKSKNKLSIFSLYMHLLPWNGYVQAKTLPTQYRIKAANMRKVEKGAIIKGKAGVIKKLTAGVIVELSGKKIGNYREVSKIVSGVEPKPEALGWIYKTTFSKIKHSEPEGKKAPKYLGKTVYKVKNTASDTETFAKDTKGVRGRIGIKGGEVLALYPRGCELELEEFAKGAKRAKVLKVVSGTAKYPAGKSDNGYVWLADLKAKVHPPTFEQVIIPAKPIPLKKGDIIGYMGQYCTPEMPKDRPMLHWEIFAGDKLKGFIGRARDANKTAKKSEKTILEVPKNTPLIWPHERPADTSIVNNAIIVKLKTHGDYIQCQTLGTSVKLINETQLTYQSAKSSVGKRIYTVKKGALTIASKALGQTITEKTELLRIIKHKDKNRTVMLIHDSKVLWVKKTIGLTKIDNARQQLKISAHAWTKYPEEFIHEVTKTTERTCLKPSELKTKKLDEYNNEWFEMSSYDNQMCSVGYINASNLTRHAPEEFICFDGVDIKGGSDASIHKDPDNYWKNLFAPITLESSQHEEGSPINDMRLDVHPFAKKVFQYIDANHDGTITLQEMNSALSNPIKQKKIATLITKHESEWVKSMDRWKYIEKYIPDATRFDWEYEKKKIQKLAWWDDVKGKVTDFPKEDAYYFHPAGFVGNLMGGGNSLGDTPLFMAIGYHESRNDYRSYNITGIKNGRFHVFRGYTKPPFPLDITKMTIAQLQVEQRKREGIYRKRLLAAGRYQAIPKTLNEYLSTVNVNVNTQLYDKEFQDSMLPWFIKKKRRLIYSYLTRGSNNINDVAYSISKEWASFGVPKGYKTKSKKISAGGFQTYYDDKPGNKAHIKAEDVVKLLIETKKIVDGGGYL